MSLPPNEHSESGDGRFERRRSDPADMLMVPSARELQSRKGATASRPRKPAPAPTPEPVSQAPQAPQEDEDETPARQPSDVRPVPHRQTLIDESGDHTFDPREPLEENEEEPGDDEIRQETERWAPESLRDTVIETQEKVCRMCGKDLRGHRRYKDDKGYLCKDCEKEDRIRRVPCAECGKPVTPESLRPWGPISICARCWADHQNDPKLRIKRKVSTRNYELVEKQNLLIIAGVAMVLLVLILIGSLS